MAMMVAAKARERGVEIVTYLNLAEEVVLELIEVARESAGDREAAITKLAGRPGFYVPAVDGDRVPPIAKAPDAMA